MADDLRPTPERNLSAQAGKVGDDPEKPGGGARALETPTILDPFLQHALLQVELPILPQVCVFFQPKSLYQGQADSERKMVRRHRESGSKDEKGEKRAARSVQVLGCLGSIESLPLCARSAMLWYRVLAHLCYHLNVARKSRQTANALKI